MRRSFCLFLLAACTFAAPAFANPAENESIARQAIEQALGEGRFEIIPRLFAVDYLFHGEDRDYSRADVEANMRGLRAAFPNLAVRVERLAASGDLVSIHWSGRGTNSVRAAGFPGTGQEVRFEGMAFVRFRDGQMVEEWAVHDSLSLFRQLGLPTPSAPQ